MTSFSKIIDYFRDNNTFNIISSSEIMSLDENIKNYICFRYTKYQILVNYDNQNIFINMMFNEVSDKEYFKYLSIYKILKKKYDTSLTKYGNVYSEINYRLPIKLDCIPIEIIKKVESIHEFIKQLDNEWIKYNLFTGELETMSQDIIKYNKQLEAINTYSLSDDSFIIDYYNEYKANFNFIKKLLFECINSNRIDVIWNPKPEFLFETVPHLNKKIFDIITDTKLRENVIKKYYTIIGNISNYMYDTQIYNICPISYIIIKFSIKHFKEFSLDNWKIDSIEKETEDSYKSVTSASRKNQSKNFNKSVKFYKVKYEDENKRKITNNPQLHRLFHGSTNQNWFSIFFNGLKTGTRNNKLFLNGAAHGTGVYLSDTTTYSYNYSNGYSNHFLKLDLINFDNKELNQELDSCILGVFILNKDKKTYYKTSQIYVVPPEDENEIMLEYLITFPTKSKSYEYLRKIDNYFINSLGSEIVKESASIMKVGNKRIMGELKKLMKNNDVLDKDSGLHYQVEYDDSNMYLVRFNLPIDNFEPGDELRKDLEKYNYNSIKMEIILPQRYPIEPPFVRLIKPRFKFMTGHITSGGSICMELLTNQGWTATTTMEKLLLIVKMNMAAGGARLDTSQHYLEYSMSEAKSAYQRMLRSHGWK